MISRCTIADAGSSKLATLNTPAPAVPISLIPRPTEPRALAAEGPRPAAFCNDTYRERLLHDRRAPPGRVGGAVRRERSSGPIGGETRSAHREGEV